MNLKPGGKGKFKDGLMPNGTVHTGKKRYVSDTVASKKNASNFFKI